MCRLGNNLAGQYKRGIGMGIDIGMGGFGGTIAANIYRSKDSVWAVRFSPRLPFNNVYWHATRSSRLARVDVHLYRAHRHPYCYSKLPTQ